MFQSLTTGTVHCTLPALCGSGDERFRVGKAETRLNEPFGTQVVSAGRSIFGLLISETGDFQIRSYGAP